MESASSSTPSLPRAWIGRYLGLVQFLLVLSWTIYVAYIPTLLARVGIGADKTAWLLLADQLLFIVCDVTAGFLAQRVFRAYGRLGPWLLAFSAVSCLAFLLIPHVAALGQPNLLLGLVVLWAACSSALRAPAFALLGRHVPPAATPAAATGLLSGMALAGIISPYLGNVLKTISPALPFALSSLTLLAVAGGLIHAERSLAQDNPPPPPATLPTLPMPVFYPLLLLAALAFQVCFSLNASPDYLRYTTAQNLAWLMPVFWIGFNVGSLGARGLALRAGKATRINARLLWAGCLLSALGMLLNFYLLPPGLNTTIMGQFIAGLGWGLSLSGAFGLAAECGQPLRTAIASGLLFAVLALATLLRIGLSLAGYPKWLQHSPQLYTLPLSLWLAVFVLVLLYQLQRRKAA